MVIFIAGTYGVGKSTLCSSLSKELNIPSFSAGDLISRVSYDVDVVTTCIATDVVQIIICPLTVVIHPVTLQ